MIQIEQEHRLIHTAGLPIDAWQQVTEWCRDARNGSFDIYLLYIQYATDKDLSKFLLRWA